jgi:hypothetical protein
MDNVRQQTYGTHHERHIMLRFASGAANWAGRHAFPVIAASVVAIGAAGGGIGYAVASQHTPAPASAAVPASPSPAAPSSSKPRVSRAQALVQRALRLLAAQTGQSVAAVQSQLAAGKSIDDIAGSKAPVIESQILAAVTKIADRAVKNGRLTAAQEAADLALAKTRIDTLMAAPGTQLAANAQGALQFFQGLGRKSAAPPTSSPSPAA